MSDTELQAKIESSRLPKMLRDEFNDNIKIGENPRAAIKHAIDRCFEYGSLSESQADKYEALFLSK